MICSPALISLGNCRSIRQLQVSSDIEVSASGATRNSGTAFKKHSQTRVQSEGCQGVRHVVLDVEELVELRDCKDLVDFRADVAQLEPSAVSLDFFIQRNQ